MGSFQINGFWTQERLLFLAIIVASNIMVAGAMWLLGNRRHHTTGNGQDKTSFIERIQEASNDIHTFVLEVVSLIAPWTPQFITAALIGMATMEVLEWPIWLALPAAFAVETIGIQAITLTLKIWEYEQVRSKRPVSPGADAKHRGDPSLSNPFWVSVVISATYLIVVIFLTYVLKVEESVAEFAPILFVVLSVTTAVGIGLKTTAQRAFKERESRLDEIEKEKTPVKSTGVKREQVAAVAVSQKEHARDGVDREQTRRSHVMAVTKSETHSPVTDLTGGDGTYITPITYSDLHAQKGRSKSVMSGRNGSEHADIGQADEHVHEPVEAVSEPVQKPVAQIPEQVQGVARTVEDIIGTLHNGTAALLVTDGSERELSQAGQVDYSAEQARTRLLQLIDQGKYLSQGDMAELVGKSRPTVSRYLAELEKAGLIVPASAPDGRGKWYRIAV